MGIFRRMFNASDEEEPDKSIQAADEQANTLPDTAIPTAPYMPDNVTRQLPALEEVITHTNAHLRFGQATDTGMVREENQDSLFSSFATLSSAYDNPDLGVFIVADGMGGHFDGRQAAIIAVRTVVATLNQEVYLPMTLALEDFDMPPITEVLVNAMNDANEKIHRIITKGGGTTCTAVVTLGNRAYIAHVGDSRAYLMGNDHIEQLTRDHSTVQRLVEVGQVTKEEAAVMDGGNVLYRALGIQESVQVDVFNRRLPAQAKLVICSDGLWNFVPDEQIKQIVLQYPDPQEACNKLVALANVNGGKDNITVIVLHVN